MKKSTLAFDYHFQLFAFVLIMLSSVTIFPLLLLVPFGAYQVLSAGFKGFAMDRYKYRIFALIAGTYGTLISWFAFSQDNQLKEFFQLFDDDLMKILAFFVYILIPVTSAIYYIHQSHQDWQSAIETEKVNEFVS
jgi:hypothetical protein